MLTAGAAASAVGILHRFAIGQTGNRPSIAIAVQQGINATTPESLREQSAVGIPQHDQSARMRGHVDFSNRIFKAPKA